jgi:RimK family alpha-L-glutamate ligase
MEKILGYYKFINEKESSKEKVLFISFTDKTRGVSYHDYLKSKLNCTFCLWTDLIFQEDKILLENKEIKDFDFIFIGVISKYPSYFTALEKYVDKYKIPNFRYGCSPERSNKIYQNSNMEMGGVPQIPTIISKCSSVNSNELIKELGLPMVSKITDGSQGKGVELQKTKMDLEKYLKKNKEETIIFQKFIENEGDYRLFFIGQDLLYTIKRKSKDDKKEFRNNYSLGGTVERIDLPKNATEIAKKASKVMGFDVSGVDLIKDKNSDNWYILEVNAAPQFGTKNGKEIVVDYKEVLDKFIEIIGKKKWKKY